MSKSIFGLFILAGLVGVVIAADEPTISDVMKKVNSKKGLMPKLDAALKANTIDWDTLKKHSQEMKKLISALPKAQPPMGEKASWDKLTKKYVEEAGKLETAVGKKDKDAAAKSFKALKGSCKACHEAHQPK